MTAPQQHGLAKKVEPGVTETTKRDRLDIFPWQFKGQLLNLSRYQGCERKVSRHGAAIRVALWNLLSLTKHKPHVGLEGTPFQPPSSQNEAQIRLNEGLSGPCFGKGVV